MITAKFVEADEVKSVIFDNELYDRITDDNCPPKEEFKIPEEGCKFIGGYLFDKLVSLFIVHGNKMHFMVLKPYRKYSKVLLDACFGRWPYSVYCEIPSLYKSVLNFAKKYGFKEVYVELKSHKKNGQLYDVHRLIYEV